MTYQRGSAVLRSRNNLRQSARLLGQVVLPAMTTYLDEGIAMPTASNHNGKPSGWWMLPPLLAFAQSVLMYEPSHPTDLPFLLIAASPIMAGMLWVRLALRPLPIRLWQSSR